MLEIEIIFRLCFALLLGGIVGFERELRKTSAGLRTHSFVCMGAAFFAVLSINFSQSPAIIAAGVVSGIGFIGAGLIFRSKTRVIGLTTASDLWVLAAIGLSVGFGYYLAALAATLLVLLMLVLGRIVEINLLKEKEKLE